MSALGAPHTGSGAASVPADRREAVEAVEAAEAGDWVGQTPHVGHGGAVVVFGLTLKNGAIFFLVLFCRFFFLFGATRLFFFKKKKTSRKKKGRVLLL
jgi:hypothetical protein